MRPLALAAVVLAAGLVSGLVAGCAPLRTAAEIVDLADEGEAEQLRRPMRPVRGTTRVLVVALDGVGDGALREALAAGDMPRLAAFLGAPTGDPDVFARAYAAPGVAAVLPSETTSGWAAVFTGRPPAETGVVGNEWFDRDSLAVYAPVPGAVGTLEQTVAVFSDGLLGELIRTPTLFERAGLRAHVALGFVHRGADLLTPPDAGDVGELVDAAADALFAGAEAGPLVAELDEDTVEGVRAGARRHGLPDLQVAYFPGPDLVAHAEGRGARRAYLRDETDRRVGEVLDLYRAAGVLDQTYVVVVADHGHTARVPNEAHALRAEETTAVLRALGLRVRPVGLGRDDRAAYQAVVAYNEAVAFVSLADRSTCPAPDDACDWRRPPRLEDDVLPVARALREAADAVPGGPALDLVLARASRPDDAVPFRVLDGGRLVPVADFLARAPRPDLVDLERRLGWLVDGPLGRRAGDVLLLSTATSGVPLEGRFHFGDPAPSGHGGAGRLDSLVPLVVAHPARTGTDLRARVRAAVGGTPTQLDVTALVLALLAEGGPLPGGG